MRTIGLLSLVLASALLAGCGQVAYRYPDRSSPEHAVKTLHQAFTRGDLVVVDASLGGPLLGGFRTGLKARGEGWTRDWLKDQFGPWEALQVVDSRRLGEQGDKIALVDAEVEVAEVAERVPLVFRLVRVESPARRGWEVVSFEERAPE